MATDYVLLILDLFIVPSNLYAEPCVIWKKDCRQVQHTDIVDMLFLNYPEFGVLSKGHLSQENPDCSRLDSYLD